VGPPSASPFSFLLTVLYTDENVMMAAIGQ
jgi:hypothetical protein